MKHLVRLEEEDIRRLIADTYNVPVDNVVTSITEEPYGPWEEMTPFFTAEVELKEGNDNNEEYSVD